MINGPTFSPNINPLCTVDFGLARGAWAPGKPRVFSNHLDGQEIDNIKFILDKLAHKSLVSLLKLKKELKSRGNKIDHVHPLTFFIGALSHECSRHFYDLKARGGMPYDEFVKGTVESFIEESKHHNITDQQLVTFAQITNRNLAKLRSLVASRSWKELINWV